MRSKKIFEPMSHPAAEVGFSHSDATARSNPNGKTTRMKQDANLPLENLQRLPGLYRRWELSEVFAPNHNYHLEEAGDHADGTPLLAVYVNHKPAETLEAQDLCSNDICPVDPRNLIPAGLVPSELVSALPLIIEVQWAGEDGPLLRSLFGPKGATIAELYLAVVDQREELAGTQRTLQALSILLDRLLEHGAGADAHIADALKTITSVKTKGAAQ